MKRFLPLVIIAGLLLILLITVLLILNFTKKKNTGPVVLHYVGLWDPEVFNPLKEEFQKKNPNVIIEYEQKDQSSYYPYLKGALASATPPDVFWWHNSWGPVLAGNLAALPTTVMSNSDYENTFYPITKEDVYINGSYRGIPLEFDGLALLYNKDLLAARGFSSAPSDFSSLEYSYAPNLVITDNQNRVTVGGVALGTTNNVANFSEILGLLLVQNKVVFTENKLNKFAANISLDQRNLAADAISVYLAFANQNKVWSSALPNSLEAFAEGKVAMIYSPAYRISDLEDFLSQNNLKLNFGVAPVPQLVKAQPVTWGSYWINGVNTLSKNQEEAWNLVKFLDQPSSLRELFQNETKNRGLGRAYPRKDMATELKDNLFLGPYLQGATEAKSWFLSSDTAENDLNGAIVSIFSKRLDQNSSSTDQSSTVSNIATDIEPILAKYGLARAVAKP